MAVTINVTALAAELRYGDGTAAPAEPINTMLGRALASATELVENYAIAAPDALHDTAAILVSRYLMDAPVSDGTRYANAIINSGAAAILERYQTRRVLLVE